MTPWQFLQEGIAVVPLLPKSKTPAVNWRRYQTELPTETQLQGWLRPALGYNFAVVCGWKHLAVLDFDDPAGHSAWLAWATTASKAARDVAFHTYQVKTARGVHAYVYVGSDAEPALRTGKLRRVDADTGEIAEWGEIKGEGGYVLIPPSIHPSGVIYQAVDDKAPIIQIESLVDVLPADAASIEPTPRFDPDTLRHASPFTGLWPETTIDFLKRSVSLLELFPSAKSSGSDGFYVTCCPWHDDERPSFWINTQKGICGCHAGCVLRETGGKSKCLDVVSAYALLHGLDTKGAIRELLERLDG